MTNLTNYVHDVEKSAFLTVVYASTRETVLFPEHALMCILKSSMGKSLLKPLGVDVDVLQSILKREIDNLPQFDPNGPQSQQFSYLMYRAGISDRNLKLLDIQRWLKAILEEPSDSPCIKLLLRAGMRQTATEMPKFSFSPEKHCCTTRQLFESIDDLLANAQTTQKQLLSTSIAAYIEHNKSPATKRALLAVIQSMIPV